jgi:hypothetical protein
MKKLAFKYLIATSILLISSISFAQYVWINEKGVKQFSDKPPPASVPKNKIIKAPNLNHPHSLGNNSNNNDNTESSEGKSKLSEIEKLEKPKTIANKNEDFNKRKQEREELEKKAKEEQTRLADNKKQCDRAKSYQRTLENGNLVTTTNKNGEKIILDGSQRAKELAETKKYTEECK